MMNIELAGHSLVPRPTGTLVWPGEGLLVVADLHLGVSGRLARRGGAFLPPYETDDTLDRLAGEIASVDPAGVICLGDSFDDAVAARSLTAGQRARLGGMAEGRDWLWIAGNHDPAPAGAALPGRWVEEIRVGPLAFRHIAEAEPPAPGTAEVSAHYHPKARVAAGGRPIARAAFLYSGSRLILPAFGTYTGGLDASDPAFDALMGPGALALLTGRRITPVMRSRLMRRNSA